MHLISYRREKQDTNKTRYEGIELREEKIAVRVFGGFGQAPGKSVSMRKYPPLLTGLQETFELRQGCFLTEGKSLEPFSSESFAE